MTTLDPSPSSPSQPSMAIHPHADPATEASTNLRPKGRTQAQKDRRKALWVSREDDRRNAERLSLLGRYQDMKLAMGRAGVRIGRISDIDERLDDPVKRFEVLKARVERWEALWSIAQRKRQTRGKIIIGGAIVAALSDLVDDEPGDGDPHGHRAWLFGQLNQRVLRVRDRSIVRELLIDADGDAAPMPLRPGGPMDESIEDALSALGEGLSAFEQRAFGGGDYDHNSSEEADLAGFIEP